MSFQSIQPEGPFPTSKALSDKYGVEYTDLFYFVFAGTVFQGVDYCFQGSILLVTGSTKMTLTFPPYSFLANMSHRSALKNTYLQIVIQVK